MLLAKSKSDWTDGPLALTATELAGLESRTALEAVGSLLDLCRALDSHEVAILSLEHLSVGDPGCVTPDRVEDLKDMIRKASRARNMTPPRFVLQGRGRQVDLRISWLCH